MTKMIVSMILLGMLAGRFLPVSFLLEYQDTLISILLCMVLFIIGLDMGQKGNMFQGVSKVGVKILFIPVMMVCGTLLFGILGGLLTGIAPFESLAVSAGFGWYSFGPVLISDYSSSLSAIAFLCNVVRETLGFVLIPVVAKKIGYIECVALPGISAMDLALPIIKQATNEGIVVYALVSGAIMSFLTPVLIPLFLSFA